MAHRTRLLAITVTAALALGVGVSPATAVARPAPQAPVSTALTAAVLGVASSSTPAPLPVPGAPTDVRPVLPGGSAATPQAIPIWLRLAAKAALEVLKRTSVSTYNQLVRAVASGKTAFLNFWAKLPKWVKDIFPAVAASALYDVFKWLLGF